MVHKLIFNNKPLFLKNLKSGLTLGYDLCITSLKLNIKSVRRLLILMPP